MRRIQFFVGGEPKAQPRPRAFAKRVGNKFFARVFDAGTAEGWKSQVALAAGAFLTGDPIRGPIGLELIFMMPRPKVDYRSNGMLKPGRSLFHTNKPDTDNLIKAVMDAITRLGLWTDDGQVCQSWTEKRYADGPRECGCHITITELVAGQSVKPTAAQLEMASL